MFLLPLVPEYEISEPYQTNADGEFVSHTLHERHTRDLHDKGAWYYKMDTFGKKMHLKLRRNTQLIKSGLELETRHKNGDVTWMPVKSDSYFHGIEASDPGSLVAVSNDEGLVRCMHFASDSKCKALAILPNDQNNNKRFEVPNI